MKIANLQLIEKFNRVHSNARNPMKEWLDKTEIAIWKTPNHIRETFPTASFVKQFVIFNIGGNKYRLLTKVLYELKVVDILKVGTHGEYDRWKL